MYYMYLGDTKEYLRPSELFGFGYVGLQKLSRGNAIC